jgi:hypothetical protein
MLPRLDLDDVSAVLNTKKVSWHLKLLIREELVERPWPRGYGELRNELVSAANGVDYACRDTGEGAVPLLGADVDR